MPAPRHFDWMASDVIDAEFALRRCQCVDLSLTQLFCFELFALNVAIVIQSALKTMADTTARAGCKRSCFGEA